MTLTLEDTMCPPGTHRETSSEDTVEAVTLKGGKTMENEDNVAKGHGTYPGRTGSQTASGYRAVTEGTGNEHTNNQKEVL